MTTAHMKKPHRVGTNQAMGLQGDDLPEGNPMATQYLTRNPFPALESRRLSGLVRFERAAFDRVLTDCCDRPNSRVDVRLTATDPHPDLSDPLTYAECCRDCAPHTVDVMAAQRRTDGPITAEVNR